MRMLFNSHELWYIQYKIAEVRFATRVLRELSDVQTKFIRQMDLRNESALMNFNLAPLATRQNIAILGTIHQASLR